MLHNLNVLIESQWKGLEETPHNLNALIESRWKGLEETLHNLNALIEFPVVTLTSTKSCCLFTLAMTTLLNTASSSKLCSLSMASTSSFNSTDTEAYVWDQKV